MFKELDDEDSEVTVSIMAEDVKKEDAEKLGEDLSDLYPDCRRRGSFWRTAHLLLCGICGVDDEYSFPNYSPEGRWRKDSSALSPVSGSTRVGELLSYYREHMTYTKSRRISLTWSRTEYRR